VDVEHIVIAKMFEEEVNSFLKGREERQPAKKRTILFGGSISKLLFLSNISSKKRMCPNLFSLHYPFFCQNALKKKKKKKETSICANFNPHLYIYFIVLCEHFSNKIKME
jgi:hypothetical protein